MSAAPLNRRVLITCPVPECRQPVIGTGPLCPAHEAMLPGELQAQLHTAFDRFVAAPTIANFWPFQKLRDAVITAISQVEQQR